MHLQLVCASNSTSANTNSLNITFATEPVLSSLDLYNSIHSNIIVLCLTILASSVLSPRTTNVIEEPFKLDDLYGKRPALVASLGGDSGGSGGGGGGGSSDGGGDVT